MPLTSDNDFTDKGKTAMTNLMELKTATMVKAWKKDLNQVLHNHKFACDSWKNGLVTKIWHMLEWFWYL